jgi:hypothetical protein
MPKTTWRQLSLDAAPRVGPPLFLTSDAFVNIVTPALTLQNNDGPPLFVNSDAFVNTVMPALTLQNNDGPPLFVMMRL